MPHVTSLATDSDVIDSPTWDDVLNSLRALDSKEKTIVVLAPASPKGVPEGEEHMSIGGGSGRYIAYVTSDNVTFWNAETAGGLDTSVTRLTVGGQEGEYAAAQIVSLDVVTIVARAYFERGERTPSAHWVQR